VLCRGQCGEHLRHLPSGLFILVEIPAGEKRRVNHDENRDSFDTEGLADSPLSASLCERFQIDLDPRRRGRTWMRARPPISWSPVRGAPRIAWRRGGNDLAFWRGRGRREGRGGGEVVEECLGL